MTKAKQTDLEGMGDRKLKDLHDAASEYADVRDERMKLLKSEVEMKTNLLTLMKKHKKVEYVYDGLTITVVPGEETVRVKKAKDGDDEEAQSN